MIRCRCCGKIADQPAEIRGNDWEEFWGARVPRETVEEQCPYCGSDDFYELEDADEDAEESPVEDQQLQPVPSGAGEPPGDPDGPSG